MSPRPEERDDVRDVLALSDEWLNREEAGQVSARETFKVMYALRKEVAALRSEREQMAARIEFLEGELVAGATAEGIANVVEQTEARMRAEIEGEIRSLRAALSEYRGDERAGVERVEGIAWRNLGVPRIGFYPDDKYDLPVMRGERATLTIRRSTPASEPGPTNPADPSPREEP